VSELMPFDLMMEWFVSATARWARSRSSSDTCGVVGGLVRVAVGLSAMTGRSDIVSSSVWARVWSGECHRVSRGISISLSLEKMKLIVGVIAFSSDSVGGICGMFVWGDGDGVEGVGVPSAVGFPSSVRMLGGKNCEPVCWCLGRD
jgi:hypothetical protein